MSSSPLKATARKPMPGTYTAVEVSAPGVLRIVERRVSDPGAGQVRIRVEACGICHTDAATVTGIYPGLTLPRVPGHEVVGRIEALGSGVSRWRIGQRAANAKALFIEEVMANEELTLKFLNPLHDSRTPDIIVQPVYGTIYTGSKKKNAEHGGFSFGDTNVALIVSNVALRARSVKTPVTTAQVAPSILSALGIDPGQLGAVRKEDTQVLPFLFDCSNNNSDSNNNN